MPNTSILPNIEGESVDAPKKFTNIDKESFEFTWDSKLLGGVLGNKTKIESGETVIMPKYMVNYAAMHLARKINKREAFEGLSEAAKAQGPNKFVDIEKEMKLQKQIVAENFEKAEIKAEEKTPEIVISNNEQEFKCDCGFMAKSKFGLQVHQRKHKEVK